MSRDRITAVWALLVAATAASLVLGSEGGSGAKAHPVVSVAVLVIAMLKVRLVGLHFMELRAAPALLRRAFEAYCVVVGLLLIGFVLAAG